VTADQWISRASAAASVITGLREKSSACFSKED
jgi:hypothetical protein